MEMKDHGDDYPASPTLQIQAIVPDGRGHHTYAVEGSAATVMNSEREKTTMIESGRECFAFSIKQR